MTLQQLRLAVETAVCGSISAAAQKLFLSQPNASQSIKKLEEELGYTIFKRGEGNAVPTEQGYLFLEHAEKILREDDAIRTITNYTNIPRLRVGVMNYTPAIEAFLRFIKENRDMPVNDFACLTVPPEKGVKLVRERALDILISLQIKNTLPSLQKLCKENRLSLTMHKSTPICIRVRRDHPLIQSGKLTGTKESFYYLKDFPFADYCQTDYLFPLFQPHGFAPFGYTYKIYADERDVRLKIVRDSNAYSIGTYMPDWKLDQYGLKAFSIGDEQAMLCSCVRKGENDLENIRHYRELLSEEADW